MGGRTHDYFCPRCEVWHGGLGDDDPEICDTCGFPCCWYDLNNEGFDGAPEWWKQLAEVEAMNARLNAREELQRHDAAKALARAEAAEQREARLREAGLALLRIVDWYVEEIGNKLGPNAVEDLAQARSALEGGGDET